MVTYLGERNIAVFSTDMDSFDFKLRKPEQIIKSIMTKLQKHGKGIVLMHDFQTGTSHAVPQLLAELKAGGYKIVHLKSRMTIQTLPQFDEGLQKDQKLPTVSQRDRHPTSYATSSRVGRPRLGRVFDRHTDRAASPDEQAAANDGCRWARKYPRSP